MAPELNDIAMLVRTVDLGSFAKVARELQVPTSTVARAVARLEDVLAMRLLQRTTRNLTLTSEGRAFYDEVAPALVAILRATRSVAGSDGTPRGVLRIAASAEVGNWLLYRSIVKLTSSYPLLRVELELSGRSVNLVEEGFDVSLRLGQLSDSSLVASKLTDLQADIYASPAYVAKHGAPTTLSELAERPCVLYRARNGAAEWTLHGPEGAAKQTVRGSITCDDYGVARAVVLEGGGIARLPRMMAVDDVRQGRLLRLLPEYDSGSRPLHFVHESSRNVAPKITVFRSLLAADIAERELEWRMLPKGADRRKASAT